MTRLGLIAIAGLLAAAAPAFGQTVGSCQRGASIGPNTPWVLFDLGSAALRAEARPIIAEAVKQAKATQAVSVCLVGHTDKLGDKAMNAKLAEARARSVATEMVKLGYPAKNIVIAADPEAFGNLSFGGSNASEKDRRVSILIK
ncbi:MAG: OmpA family protein [Enhydrobacter sp.]|nr:MAG: OmpA family protein [Enhydrobacter sp.]